MKHHVYDISVGFQTLHLAYYVHIGSHIGMWTKIM